MTSYTTDQLRQPSVERLQTISYASLDEERSWAADELDRLQAIVERSTAVTEDGVRVILDDHVFWWHGGWAVVDRSELGMKLSQRYSTREAAEKARQAEKS